MKESEDKIIQKLEKEDRLGLRERNIVQIGIMKKMLKSKKIETELEWAENYSKLVGDIIDDPRNTEIRELIRKGDKDETKYDQAADLIISLLPDLAASKAD